MTNIPRWIELAESAESPWNPRLRTLAERIAPGETVVDVGAGGRWLRDFLEPSSLYLPVDCIPYSPIRFDFNAEELPPRLTGDVAVMSGVLEYIENPVRALSIVQMWCKRILLSYAIQPADHAPRIAAGWVNHLTEGDLISAFERVGLTWRSIGSWDRQSLWELRR